ncbi:hypothetical protein MY04_5154 [Flammeovirga sp. MY04]|uniref:hypothetical protein n=1 Tax=Flammeovirga sp. MY04 TaxID=1191459 RepID=UPI000806356A|nr:hypothetical protein [Flammeovirga sp. MY04]ANQ52486.1 hypothetical protein MY04_5154 [Flammeovirga sp. MY04]
MKLLSAFILFIIFSSAVFSQSKLEKEARHFTFWMDNIVNLNDLQKRQMQKARYSYLVVKKDPKNANMGLSEKIELDQSFWEKRNEILTEDQLVTLGSYLKTNNDIKDLRKIIDVREDQTKVIEEYFIQVNKNVVIQKNEHGILSDQYDDAFQRAKTKKEKFLLTILDPNQQESYKAHLRRLGGYKEQKTNVLEDASPSELTLLPLEE